MFRGIDARTGSFVAIKELQVRDFSEGQLQLIQTEVGMLRRLHHPRVVRCDDFITDEATGTSYLVLELIDNGSLAEVVKVFGPLPESVVKAYVRHVLEALGYLHANGVVHRDVKGSNLLVTREGSIKLADFGVATMEHKSGDEVAVGSPFWMAPEAIEMSEFTTAADIWSLGCCVVELLTGEPPYFGMSQISALYHMVNDDSPPLPDDLPLDLQSFLGRCFVKDPRGRATARELLAHPWLWPAEDQEHSVIDLSRTPGQPAHEGDSGAIGTQTVAEEGHSHASRHLEGDKTPPSGARRMCQLVLAVLVLTALMAAGRGLGTGPGEPLLT